MEFEYFKNPKEFSFLVDDPQDCSICGEKGLWFDGCSFSGVEDIECICDACLKSGKLKELDIESNLNFDDGSEASETIIYKTPSLPTWQDTAWPLINGKFPVFERIASKEDFFGKDEFCSSFSDQNSEKPDINWLWDMLPDKSIKSYKEGHDVSVYLFTLKGDKYWVWDAN